MLVVSSSNAADEKTRHGKLSVSRQKPELVRLQRYRRRVRGVSTSVLRKMLTQQGFPQDIIWRPGQLAPGFLVCLWPDAWKSIIVTAIEAMDQAFGKVTGFIVMLAQLFGALQFLPCRWCRRRYFGIVIAWYFTLQTGMLASAVIFGAIIGGSGRRRCPMWQTASSLLSVWLSALPLSNTSVVWHILLRRFRPV